MQPTRQIFWNTNGKAIMYVCALLALVIFAVGCYRKVARWHQGQKSNDLTDLRQRFTSLCLDVLVHRNKVFKGRFYRKMHLNIFYGFMVLIIGTLVIAIQLDFHVPIFQGDFYVLLSLLLNLSGLAVILGVLMATYKRIVKKPDPIDDVIGDDIILGLVFIALFTGFLLDGLRIYATADQWALWSPVGLLFAKAVKQFGLSAASARAAYRDLWYLHMLLAFGLIAYVPYSKLFHMFATPFNIFLQSSHPKGALLPVASGCPGNPGAATLADFRRKQLVELDACVSCSRCQKHCPAYVSGDPLSPKEMVQNLKRYVKHGQLIDTVIAEETLWACTTCGLCEEKCPAMIEHINRIVDLRRHRVSELSSCPPQLKTLFTNILQEGNPWGISQVSHAPLQDLPKLAEKRHAEVLHWVGCFGAFDARNQRVTRAMAEIFTKAGVDFAILGSEQNCCGDGVRRLGNEGLFQQLAKENINTLNSYSFQTIVTHCAHCYNSLKNEYPQFGGNYEVLHHSEFILDMITSGRIAPKQVNHSKVTYHDPCYLGRFNNIYDPPRKVLTAIPGLELVEMRHSRVYSDCCGAGGGRIWLAENQEVKKINERRAKEAAETEPAILASACSLCLSSLSGAINSLHLDINSKDIAEIVNDAL